MYRFLVLAFLCTTTFASVMVKEVISANKSVTKEISYSTQEVSKEVVLRELPMFMGERDFVSPEIYRETLYPNYLPGMKSTKSAEVVLAEGSEVRTIIKQGPDENRIILTVLGDGYTIAEKEKFFDDAKFIVDDLFVGVTYKSFLPFFNIYAVFTPSKDSGITDRVKKNTAFGLYRSPVGSKRGIMPGNTAALEQALKLAPAAAHYPIVIANDEYYGGLGGRYAISTRSKVSGPIVLRHELGHNFSNVGEEYDDGQVYSGANFSRSAKGTWDQWKSNGNSEVHNADYIFGDYIWQELSSPYVKEFTTTDNAALFSVKISSVGWEKEGDVEFLLDGAPLTLNGHYTADRSFFESEPFPIKSGKHTLVIRSNGNNPKHVLAFADGFAYPADYDFSYGQVKAFNVFNENRMQMGYRPTENMCIMRDMLSKVLCPVDQENIWLQFLKRVSLIDSLKKNTDGSVEVKTIPFDTSTIDVTWFENGREVSQYHGLTKVPARSGTLKARVKLVTPEVRITSEHFQDEKSL